MGRGLEALIPERRAVRAAERPRQRSPAHPDLADSAQSVSAAAEFDPAELAELEASLKASGLLQPISVRRQGDAFELIAGERRLRAATNLGWTEISAIVRDFDDQTMLVLALVENLQRANLNAIEEARGYRRLIDEFQLTQQQVADAVGKDRTTVTNLLRVLSLPDEFSRWSSRRAHHWACAGAARAAAEPLRARARRTRRSQRGLSVRELEQRVRELSGQSRQRRGLDKRDTELERPADSAADPAVRRIEDDLRQYLQTDVRVHACGDAKGKIELAFYSNDDLDRLLDLVLREERQDF